MLTALAGLSMVALAGCSNDPGTTEVIAQLEFEEALPAAGQATVQLVPKQPSAGLPVFTAERSVEAGATAISVAVGYEQGAASGVDYQLSARIDAPGVLLLGRSEATPEMDADGDRLRVELRAP